MIQLVRNLRHDCAGQLCSMTRARVCALRIAVLLSAGGGVALADPPMTCESLTGFSYPDTTINFAGSMPGGPYVAPDAWHLAFTNLPPWCQVHATISPTADSSI